MDIFKTIPNLKIIKTLFLCTWEICPHVSMYYMCAPSSVFTFIACVCACTGAYAGRDQRTTYRSQFPPSDHVGSRDHIQVFLHSLSHLTGTEAPILSGYIIKMKFYTQTQASIFSWTCLDLTCLDLKPGLWHEERWLHRQD